MQESSVEPDMLLGLNLIYLNNNTLQFSLLIASVLRGFFL